MSIDVINDGSISWSQIQGNYNGYENDDDCKNYHNDKVVLPKLIHFNVNYVILADIMIQNSKPRDLKRCTIIKLFSNCTVFHLEN